MIHLCRVLIVSFFLLSVNSEAEACSGWDLLYDPGTWIQCIAYKVFSFIFIKVKALVLFILSKIFQLVRYIVVMVVNWITKQVRRFTELLVQDITGTFVMAGRFLANRTKSHIQDKLKNVKKNIMEFKENVYDADFSAYYDKVKEYGDEAWKDVKAELKKRTRGVVKGGSQMKYKFMEQFGFVGNRFKNIGNSMMSMGALNQTLGVMFNSMSKNTTDALLTIMYRGKLPVEYYYNKLDLEVEKKHIDEILFVAQSIAYITGIILIFCNMLLVFLLLLYCLTTREMRKTDELQKETEKKLFDVEKKRKEENSAKTKEDAERKQRYMELMIQSGIASGAAYRNPFFG